ncbi:MAG: DUF2071 domain-containing protein [Acidobacteria bacterium]|nr:DUF2071 domain-containing protein [Acidobacteriota bacterium]
MANYAIDPAVLAPYVPRGMELDAWQGRHYVSLVGFFFLHTRVLGVPIPFHRHFEELNLRFYVRRKGPDGWRRGVVFIKEFVPRWAIATTARVVYGENYETRPMRFYVERDVPSPLLVYEWYAQKRWHALGVKTKGTPQPLTAGSETEFITEHYWGYTAQRDGGCVEYQVEHPPWWVWQTSSVEFAGDPAALYGAPFADVFASTPTSAFVAEGSPVTVRRGVRIN